jgi:rhamnose transport system substrate-binding protein
VIRKAIVTIALAASLAALAAILLPGPSGAAHRKYTFAFVTDGVDPRYAIARGGRTAARNLGVRYILAGTPYSGPGPPGTTHPFHDLIRVYKSMIARHVDAIATHGYNPPLKPILTKVRKAGILLVSSGDDIAAKRDLWVNYSGQVAFAHALADALASQIDKKGEYAILDEQGEFPIAHTEAKAVAAYIPKAYPNMRSDGLQTETGAGDEREVDSVKSFIAAHPNLKGLISITPTEAYVAAEAITQAGRIGQVFSAGNGGDDFKGTPLVGWVRSGAMEDVVVGNPIKLGYLTVWAAHYLLTGHHFRPGAYQVGGPIGLVWYYAKHRELRLGQPITITKKNVDRYANRF